MPKGKYKHDNLTPKHRQNISKSMKGKMPKFILVENAMINTTDEGDLVLDPYCGSGTVGVVAKRLNRKFVGLELNPVFVKLAEERING